MSFTQGHPRQKEGGVMPTPDKYEQQHIAWSPEFLYYTDGFAYGKNPLTTYSGGPA
jgi:hypothetical protein